MVDLSVNIAGIELKNPLMPASGVFGFGSEYIDFFDPNILGAMSLKGTTLEPRFGNPTPRVAECEAGMINSIGLQNPGIDTVIAEDLPALRKIYKGVILANIGGFSEEEYAECCARADGYSEIIELNISCPNVHADGMNFGSFASGAAQVTRAARRAVKKSKLFVKLSPNVADITEIARAVEAEGADGLTLINTLLGMRIDIKTGKPIIANRVGGFSGRAIFPVALRMINDTARAVQIPIIGAGGVHSAETAVEMMMAGASAVQIGAENLRNPLVMPQILEVLPEVLEGLGVSKITDIIGRAL